MTKDVFDCMRECHSVRSFQPDPIPDATLGRILEAASWAPSAGNLQPWYFYVVINSELKHRLAEAAFEQQQIEAAPVAIVLMADPARSNERYGERGAQLYCIQDTAAAAQNMLLAAEGLGLGACWVGAFDERRVQELVEAPPRLRAVAILCIGYSDEPEDEYKERFSVAEVTKLLH
ncbi:nitroreductase [Lucifera butyrica]|uniref:Nitroreductase n=1 Tax=Lucifera butyrica TaxID=1351585 RepID=A0A498R4V9_9FIRM|nr:nitroreductase family protein [Lucifera butyrica]VBB06179.1 nitroreductase [Lucifera butyrica]